MKSNNFVSVRLFGGLGNQIFQYMAGKSIAMDQNWDLHIDSSWLRDGYTHEKATISEFKFYQPDYKYEKKHRNRLHLYLDRLATVASRESAFAARILKIHAPSNTGFEDLSELESGIQLRGYYQSPHYYKKLANSGVISEDSFDLVEPSQEFNSLATQLQRSGYIAIHVRGGDYLQNKSGYTQLTREYYLKAFNLLDPTYGHLPVWVFTDDESYARKLFCSIPYLNFFVNKTLTAAETMVLMSRADAIICANSTFSYWAGLISGKTSSIVVPKSWMEKTIQPEDFFLAGWQTI